MNAVQIPGICDPEAAIEKKKKETKYKLCVDLLDGSLTIRILENGDKVDTKYFVEIQDITEKTFTSLGKPIHDRDSLEDQDIHCDRCDQFYRPYCKLHPLFKIPDRSPSDLEGKPLAYRTLPLLFRIATSSLPNAGLGVFAEAFCPVGMVFGPYKGIKVGSKKDFFADGYAWEVKGKNGVFYVDGSNPEKSNWLRYINSPRHEAEQNMLAFQTNGKVFYRVIKPIRVNEELMVWYGANFGGKFAFEEKTPKVKNPFIWVTQEKYTAPKPVGRKRKLNVENSYEKQK